MKIKGNIRRNPHKANFRRLKAGLIENKGIIKHEKRAGTR
jgi:hypothetical protein